MSETVTVPDALVDVVGAATVEPLRATGDPRIVTVRLIDGDGDAGGVRFLKYAPTDLARPEGHQHLVAAEAERLRWLDGRARTPRLWGAGERDGVTWLATHGLEGTSSHLPEHRMDLRATIAAIAGGLRELHDTVAVDDCPFDARYETEVDAVAARLGAGLVDVAHLRPALARIKPERLVEILRTSPRKGDDDLVVTHGDAAMPNVLVAAGSCTGLVDLGRLGVADRHRDLADCATSLAANIGPEALPPFFEAYGIEPDAARLDQHTLIAELS
ncbi:MAG: phosphotransferase [Actinomycetota bacterium]|nr:phosphotransferase [Actinomycetota bacterium]